MSGVILGSSKGLSLQQLYPWASSALQTGNRVVLLSMDKDNMLHLQLKGLGVEVVQIEDNSNLSPHNGRFLTQHDYLIGCSEEYAVMTDVRDVIFQSDPIEWIKTNLGEYNIVCASEGLAYKDEPWGDSNLKEGYPELYDSLKDNTIVNVGVIGGKTKEVANVSKMIYEMCKSNKAYLADQSSFNVLCSQKNMEKTVYKATSNDSFCLNAGTFIRGAVGGRFVLSDATAHLLKEPEPVMEDGELKTPNKVPYCIIHQWDRIP